MVNELSILTKSSGYIIQDLQNRIMEDLYKPSKQKAIEDIKGIVSLKDEELLTYTNTVNFNSQNTGIVPRAFQILIETEGFRGMPYPDPLSGKGFYIGYGQAIYRTQGGWKTGFGYFIPDASLPIGTDIAREMLLQKMVSISTDLKKLLNRKMRTDKQLNDNQFSALCCLIYNIGIGELSTYKLIQEIYDGNFEKAPLHWMDITNGGIPSLIKKRTLEVELFNS